MRALLNDLRSMRLVREAFWQLRASLGPDVLAAFTALLTRNLLGPQTYGQLALVDLVSSAAGYPASAVRAAMERGVPVLHARNEPQRAQQLQRTCLGVTLLIGGVAAVVTLVATLNIDNHTTRLTYRFWAIVFVLQGLVAYYKIRSRAVLDFRTPGELTVRYGILQSLTTLVFVWRFGVAAFFPAIAIATAAQVLHFHLRTSPTIWPSLNLRTLPEMFRQAAPVVLIGGLALFFSMLDRLTIARAHDVTALGVYSVVTLVGMYVAMACSSVSGLFQARTFFEREQATVGLLHLRARLVAVVASAVVGSAWFAVQLLPSVMPQFSGAMWACRAYLPGCFFLASGQVYLTFLTSRRTLGPASGIYSLALLVTGTALVLAAHSSMVAIAAIQSGGSALLVLGITLYTARIAGDSSTLLALRNIVGPCVAMAVAVAVAELVILALVQPWMRATIGFAVFGTTLTLILFRSDRELFTRSRLEAVVASPYSAAVESRP